jgi:hypothetical protein
MRSLSRAPVPRRLPSDARDQARTFASTPRELRADRNEFLELRTVFEQAKALKSLGSKPLAVLSVRFASITTRAIADVVRATRSSQPLR